MDIKDDLVSFLASKMALESTYLRFQPNGVWSWITLIFKSILQRIWFWSVLYMSNVEPVQMFSFHFYVSWEMY